VPEWAIRQRRFALSLALAGSFLHGVLREIDAVLDIPTFLLVASAVVLFCQLDALLHGKIYQRAFAWLLMFTWPLGVAVHLYWTRRWRGLLLYVAFGFVQSAAVAVGAGAGNLVLQARPNPLDTLEVEMPSEGE